MVDQGEVELDAPSVDICLATFLCARRKSLNEGVHGEGALLPCQWLIIADDSFILT